MLTSTNTNNNRNRNRNPPRRLLAVALTLVALTLVATAAGEGWYSWGGSLTNQRWAEDEDSVTPATAGSLAVDWVFRAAGDVSATPVVKGNRVYVTDWGGKISALRRQDGALVWQVDVRDITGVQGFPGLPVFSRTSPAVSGHRLVFGAVSFSHVYVFALNARDGSTLWRTEVETHPWAQITQSPVIWNGLAFVGTSSNEEAVGVLVDPTYPCCTFQAKFLAVRVSDGALVWTTPMLPPNNGSTGGYSGAAIWGSSPAVDPGTATVYFATGNNYGVPAAVASCLSAAGDDLNAQSLCYDPSDRFDSVAAVDAASGDLRWSRRLERSDVWVLECALPGAPSARCPTFSGPDHDFGQAPMLLKRARILGARVDALVVGQKSGILWALRASDGAVLWGTQVCPGGENGGHMWGSSSDGVRAYVACVNSGGANFSYPAVGGGGTSAWTTSGVFAAVEIADGTVAWATPAEKPYGPTSVANGVVFGSTLGGDLVALDAASGAELWRMPLGTSANAGFAVSGGTVYVGSGYTRSAGVGDNRVFALSPTACA
jgi:polyvinyl alcohol dehydrogenase (cytochrome)